MHSWITAATPLAVLIALAALVTSWAATGLVRRYALARAILDVPNHRSSHTVPTPRGGGLAILVAVLAGALALGAAGILRTPTLIGIGGGASIIAAIGWVDDRRGVPARWRALVQFGAAAWALYWLGGLPVLTLGTWELELGITGSLLAAVAIVWCTNLYNFMDGIDGIAAGQAASSGMLGAALMALAGRPGLAALLLVVAGASLGFLRWNWSPARIFMGDVGSSMLGFIFATVAVSAQRSGNVSLVVSLALGAPFVLDATVTLVRRVMNGDKWYEAHRSHAYQRAVQAGRSHAEVSGFVVAANVVVGGLLVATYALPLTQLAIVALGVAALMVAYVLVERRLPMPHRLPAVPAAVGVVAPRPVVAEPVPVPAFSLLASMQEHDGTLTTSGR